MKDAVGLYLDQIGRIPRISPEEELRLSEQIAGRDPSCAERVEVGRDALEQLVLANLRLVVSIARRYPTNSRADLSDLIQAGNDGLLKAAARFDGRKGFRFSTYATRWITQSISRHLDKNAAAASMPIDACFRIRSAMRAAAGQPGALPEDLRVLELGYNAASLDQPVAADEGGTSLADLQPDRHSDTEADALRRIEVRTARARVRQLPEPHRAVVTMRYGLDGGVESSYADLAAALGTGTDVVARILREAKQLLRD